MIVCIILFVMNWRVSPLQKRLMAVTESHERQQRVSQQRIADLQSTVESLRSQVAQANAAASVAKSAQLDVQARLEDALREVQRERDAAHALVAADKSQQAKIQQLQRKVDDLKDKVASAEAAKAQEQRVMAAERAKAAATETRLAEVTEELELVKAQAKSLSAQLADQQALLGDMRRRHGDELANLQRQVESEREHNRDCQAEANESSHQVAQLSVEVKEISGQLDQARVRTCCHLKVLLFP